MFANIQKFIQFQLTVNVAALVINVVAAFSSGDVPLNTVQVGSLSVCHWLVLTIQEPILVSYISLLLSQQLLWVNLIMDTLGALALATEPPTDHLMDRPPMGRRSFFFSPLWNLVL